MKARPARWIALGGLLIVVASLVVRYTVFFDAQSRWNEWVGQLVFRDGRPEFIPGMIKIDQSWFDENSRRFHQGDPPCLRHLNPASIQDGRVEDLARAIDAAGLLELFEQHGYFNSLFYTWRVERAARAHALDEPEELVAAVSSRLGWWQRLLIWLNREKLIRIGQVMNEHGATLIKEADGQASTLDARRLDQLRGLWSRFGVETTPPGLVKLIRRLRRRITVARMKRIGRAIRSWTKVHASPPRDLRELVQAKQLTVDQIRDGWQMEIQLELQGDRVRLVSRGADRRAGGSGADADITRELRDVIVPARAHE